MKYTVIYGGKGDKYADHTNNKATAKKWANESHMPATVVLTANGDIVYENKARRRDNRYRDTLRRIAEAIRSNNLAIK